jgi:hypothetical protein
MDKAALVGIDIDRGAEVLTALDKAGLKIRVAMWLYADEYEDWRLVLSGPDLDNVGLRDAYGRVHEALDAAGIPRENVPTLFLLPMTDPFIKGLRRSYAKANHLEGKRIGPRTVGDRWVEGSYLYRIT